MESAGHASPLGLERGKEDCGGGWEEGGWERWEESTGGILGFRQPPAHLPGSKPKGCKLAPLDRLAPPENSHRREKFKAAVFGLSFQ